MAGRTHVPLFFPIFSRAKTNPGQSVIDARQSGLTAASAESVGNSEPSSYFLAQKCVFMKGAPRPGRRSCSDKREKAHRENSVGP
jgi:hypothetical protein